MSNFSGMGESSQLFMSVKKEIKEENLDDFQQYDMNAFQKETTKPGNEHNFKTESSTSSNLTCDEEKCLVMETKTTETSEAQDDSSHMSMLLSVIFY